MLFRSLVLDGEIKALNAKITGIREQLTGDDSVQPPAQTELEAARQAVQTRIAMNDGIQRCLGSAESKTQELDRLKTEVDYIEGEQSRIEKKMAARALLDGVKAVMHRTALPHDLASLYVQDINNRLVQYCERLRLPFDIFVHPDTLRFMTRIDNAVAPISQLSGGQQTMAAWAWHLSLYEKHGSAFGMLLMDEPTSGVDVANMESLAETIRYMNTYCAGAGIQMLIITHESALTPCFSHVSQLS